MSPPSDPNADRQLDDLGRRLDEFEKRAEVSGSIPRKNASAAKGNPIVGKALKIATELVAAVVVGGVIGWALDRWLDTRPWLLLVFLTLGIAAGFKNVFRVAWEMQAEAEAEQKRAPRVRDEDED